MTSVSALMGMALFLAIGSPDMGVPKTSDMGKGGEAVAAQPSAEMGKWMTSFEEARKIAQEKQLPLVLHFEADWCSACRTMDTAVLNQVSVTGRLGTDAIGVRIDADRDPSLISQYGIASLPTEVVLRPDGTESARYVGGTSLTEYQARLNKARDTKAASSSESVASDDPDETLRPCLLVRHDGKLVGLGGYSPVAMHSEKKWIKGSESFVGTWNGVEYFFQSAEEREQFFASPEQFIPRLHGCDPVEMQRERRAEAGVIELGAFYKGRLFFFLNEENRQRFQNNPSWYADGLSSDHITNAEDFPFLKAIN